MDDAVLDDRGAYWARRRGLGRVVEVPLEAAGDGRPAGASAWCALDPRKLAPHYGYDVTRRDDVLAALHDPETFVWDVGELGVVGGDGCPIEGVPASFGPAEHARFARQLRGLFTTKSLAPFGDGLRAHARSLIAAVVPAGRCDFAYHDVSRLFHWGAWLEVCGIGAEHASAMHAVMRVDVNGQPWTAATDDVRQHRILDFFITRLAAGYRRRPGILWDLMDSVDTADSLTMNQFFGFILFCTAASPNVFDTLPFAIMRLASDAELRRRLCENPDLVGLFVEEVVRLDAPGVAVPRVTSREVQIGDCTIPAGTRVSLCVESANREDGGDEFSIDRRRRHWKFGAGMHRCVAAHLARMELAIFVTEWLCQIPEFELEPGSQSSVLMEHGRAKLTALPLQWDTGGQRI